MSFTVKLFNKYSAWGLRTPCSAGGCSTSPRPLGWGRYVEVWLREQIAANPWPLQNGSHIAYVKKKISFNLNRLTDCNESCKKVCDRIVGLNNGNINFKLVFFYTAWCRLLKKGNRRSIIRSRLKLCTPLHHVKGWVNIVRRRKHVFFCLNYEQIMAKGQSKLKTHFWVLIWVFEIQTV